MSLHESLRARSLWSIDLLRPMGGLILVAKTHRAFYDMRLQLASGLLKREPRWRLETEQLEDGAPSSVLAPSSDARSP